MTSKVDHQPLYPCAYTPAHMCAHISVHLHTYKQRKWSTHCWSCLLLICVHPWAPPVSRLCGRQWENRRRRHGCCPQALHNLFTEKHKENKTHMPFRKDSACAWGIRGAQQRASEDKDSGLEIAKMESRARLFHSLNQSAHSARYQPWCHSHSLYPTSQKILPVSPWSARHNSTLYRRLHYLKGIEEMGADVFTQWKDILQLKGVI